MALGILGIFTWAIVIISVIGLALLWIIRNEKSNLALSASVTAWAALIAVINWSAQPSNYVVQQWLCIAIGAVAVVGLIVRLMMRKHVALGKLLISLSVIGGLIAFVL